MAILIGILERSYKVVVWSSNLDARVNVQVLNLNVGEYDHKRYTNTIINALINACY